MKKIIVAFGALLALTAAVPAYAGAVAFNFSSNTPTLFGQAFTGSGDFNIADTSSTVGGFTAFEILSITGQVNGSSIVAPLNASGYGNYFSTGPSFIDGTGVRFSDAAGTSFDFFFQDNLALYRINTLSPGSSSFVTASASPVAVAVPEPASWSLFAGALGLAGVAARFGRKRAKTAKA